MPGIPDNIMATNETYCRHLNSIPHTSPDSVIWGFALPWLVALICAGCTIIFASDAVYLSNDKTAAKSSTATDDVPNDNNTADNEPHHPTPSSKALAFATASTTFFLATLAVANQVVGLLAADSCLPPSARDHWWFTFWPGLNGDLWSATTFYLGTPLLIAAVAWLKTAANVVGARWGVYFDDARWHHYLGLHILTGLALAPLVLVVLVLYGVALLVVGKGGREATRRCGKVVGFVDDALRDPQAAGLMLRDRWGMGEADGEMEPLLGDTMDLGDGDDGDDGVPPYEGVVESPPPYEAK